MNKRGLEMIWSVVITLILALLILGILVYFFTTTSGSFNERVNQLLKKSNVDEVVNSCNLLANSNQEYGYCCESKEVKYFEDGKLKKAQMTCNQMKDFSFGVRINEIDCVSLC